MRKIEEWRAKSKKDLLRLLEEKRKELAHRKMELRIGKLKNVHLLASLRKEIARILTILREKELER